MTPEQEEFRQDLLEADYQEYLNKFYQHKDKIVSSDTLQVAEYTGQTDIAIIQNKECLKNPIYQTIVNFGTTLVSLESFISYNKQPKGINA